MTWKYQLCAISEFTSHYDFKILFYLGFQEAYYTSQITMSYQVDTPGKTIGSNCFVDSYRGVIALITPQTESHLGTACTSGLGSTIEINIDEGKSLYSTVKFTSTAVSYSVLNLFCSLQIIPTNVFNYSVLIGLGYICILKYQFKSIV